MEKDSKKQEGAGKDSERKGVGNEKKKTEEV
jgi:hypothetical protein